MMRMDRWFAVSNPEEVASPALLVDADRVERNLDRMLEITGGDPGRLRPHVKTHKMAEVVRLQMKRGISRFKAATIAECEMTARCGVAEVLLACQPVGPNAGRFAALRRAYPGTAFSCVVDDAGVVETLGAAGKGGGAVDLFVDIDCGMHRTGIAPENALALIRRMGRCDGVRFAGLHVYDGQIHDPGPGERGEAFAGVMDPVRRLLESLGAEGIEVPLVVGGGSPTFGLHAELAGEFGIPWQCSPGTVVFWDAGYGSRYPDLGFEAAAVLLTRVLSRPGRNRVCLDLGHKAVSAENPLEKRVLFPDWPDAEPVMQSEEHLVVETGRADEVSPGTVVHGIPWHVCPTVALHQEAVVIRGGRVTGERWEVTARDRRIGI